MPTLRATAAILALGTTVAVTQCADGEAGEATEAIGLRRELPTVALGTAADPDSVRAAIARRVSQADGNTPGDLARGPTSALYETVRFAPFWSGRADFRSRAAVLVDALARADAHGLRRSDYDLAELAAALEGVGGASTASDAWARADVALTRSLVAYVDDLLTGRVDPRAVESAWHVEPRTVDADSAALRALRAPDLERALAGLAPQEDGYATLVRALATYRGIARAGGWPTVPPGGTLHPGDSASVLDVLRRRLVAEGDLEAPQATPPASGRRYEGPVVEAVARFQARHGLTVDSTMGRRTREALNVSAAERARQIATSLERYRWLPRVLGERYIVVNVPAFRLDAYADGARALSMRVVVGSELASRRTPIFSDSMSYVQFGPYWNVPRSIAVNEILPLARRDRGYLERNDYEIVRGWGDDAPVVDPWRLSDAALGSSRYRVRQRPGPGNALGRVKFMFPNDFNVYLHDTPARALFGERVRAYSHGCVRVADPAALARFALAERAGWTAERIAETLRDGQRVRAVLPRKIPVYLIYLTAFDRDGAVAFRDDLYDLDGPLTHALHGAPEPPGTDALVARLQQLVAGTAAE